MQIKKFEAPTLQEALESIKRELGPEAVILQTKKHKKGFGLMSKPSVEVTAAVSERSLEKKKYVESRIPDENKGTLGKLPAKQQAELLDKYTEQRTGTRFAQKMGSLLQKPEPAPASKKKLTATRYIDIDSHEVKTAVPATSSAIAEERARVQRATTQFVESKTQIEDEVRQLKRMIEELKTAQNIAAQPAFGGDSATYGGEAGSEAIEQLILSGVDKKYAVTLVRNAMQKLPEFDRGNSDLVLDNVAIDLMKGIHTASAFAGIKPDWQSGGPTVIALVGPTGVGKTTTVAKLASEAILKRNLKVGLINLDNYKVAALDQLATYAKILNVPFRSVSNAQDLQSAIQDFKSLDVVLIDTTGRSQKDPNALAEMQKILGQITGANAVRTQLVLSSVTRDAELYDIVNRFDVFKPQGMIVSKLDEATVYGSIYNICQKTELPLLYFTTGQRVPEDIEEATRERVAALILNF